MNKAIIKRIVAFMLVLAIAFTMVACGGSNKKDRTCAWCNGTGYSGNGAKNATEYVFKKTPCKHCNGTGHY